MIGNSRDQNAGRERELYYSYSDHGTDLSLVKTCFDTNSTFECTEPSWPGIRNIILAWNTLHSHHTHYIPNKLYWNALNAFTFSFPKSTNLPSSLSSCSDLMFQFI